ncbi:MAG: DUF3810 family protein [Clostridia bacterium]|nr:DUF3810 family protein [Clostridia bacterium]
MAVMSAWIRQWIFLPLHGAGEICRWPLLAILLLWALFPLVRRRPGGTFRRLAALTAVAAALALCWVSLYDAPVELARPDEAALLALADELCEALNGGQFAPTSTAEMLEVARRLTPEATAHFHTGDRPWLLTRMRAAGLFLPFFNEIWMDTAEPAVLQPFTAVHERFHASGYADEGTANRLAYEACISEGGSFAHSARIYAAKLLWQAGSPAVRRRLYTQLSEENLWLLRQAGAFQETGSALPAWVVSRLPGAVSYDDLIAYLADSSVR